MATAVKVKRSVVVALLTDLGMKGADKLSDAKLQGKLKTVPAKIDEDTEVENEAAGKLLEQIAENPEIVDNIEIVADKEAKKGKASKAGAKDAKASKSKGKGKKAAKDEDEDEEDDEEEDDEADDDEEGDDEADDDEEGDDEEEEGDEEDEEEDEDEEDDEEEASSKKKKKGGKADKKSSKSDKASKSGKKAKGAKGAKAKTAETDKFGCRLGSQAAEINAVLTKKSQKADKIAEASKQKAYRVKSHLAAMEEKGHVKKTEKGYCLA